MEVGNQKILITGGLGNLGSWLTEYYSRLGYNVTVLTKNIRKLEINVPYSTVQCNIKSLEECQAAIVKKYDVIIHTASMNDNFVEGYAKDALAVNAWGTRNILEAIKDNPPDHFIYLSTFHIYGKYSGKINEDTALLPKNDYGLTHLFAEYYLKQYHLNHNIPYTIIRLSNSYGCPKDYNSSKWYLILNDLSRSAFFDDKIKLNGNGLATRDFIWMGDVCSIIHKLTLKESTNDTYTLGGEKSYSLLDVARAVKEAYTEHFKKDINIEINDNDKSSPREPICIDSTKLKQIVPYSAQNYFKEEALNIFHFLNRKEDN